MDTDLHINLADDATLPLIHQQSHVTWGHGRSVTQYTADRLASPRHSRATWWVARDAEGLRAALACYPLRFWHHGRRVAGYGIGSLHTHTDARRRGIARRLCESVIAHNEAQGAMVGLLFSDLNPDYYAQMGFTSCHHHRYECDVLRSWNSDGLHAAPSTSLRLSPRPIDPHEHLDLLTDAWKATYRHSALATARDRSDWRHSLRQDNDDVFYTTLDTTEATTGFVRLWMDEARCFLIESASLYPSPSDIDRVAAAVASMAAAQGRQKLITWQIPGDAMIAHFTARARSKAITMIRPGGDVSLDPAWCLERCVISGADYI